MTSGVLHVYCIDNDGSPQYVGRAKVGCDGSVMVWLDMLPGGKFLHARRVAKGDFPFEDLDPIDPIP